MMTNPHNSPDPMRANSHGDGTSAETVVVIGLGYVGLPTASILANAGVRVHGVDTDADIVRAIQAGDPRTSESDVRDLSRAAIASGMLTVSTELTRADAYIVAVPSPVKRDHRADLTYVREAIRGLAPLVTDSTLIVLESTVPPGTMAHVVIPELESAGLNSSRLLLAHCPERVLPGATLVEMVNNDRIVGALNDESARRATGLYANFVKGHLHITDFATAELVKVMENTYRDVNIALANEFALVSQSVGVDVWHAIKLANNHPRVNIHRPGPGVGGHCIAVDPWFLVQLHADATRLVRTARETNDSMPWIVVDRVLREIDVAGGPVALLGLAYRGDIGDVRESPALAVHAALVARGIAVRAHDPHVTITVPGVPNYPLEDALNGASVILVVTAHSAFAKLDPGKISNMVSQRAIFDATGYLDKGLWTKADFEFIAHGSPS